MGDKCCICDAPYALGHTELIIGDQHLMYCEICFTARLKIWEYRVKNGRSPTVTFRANYMPLRVVRLLKDAKKGELITPDDVVEGHTS